MEPASRKEKLDCLHATEKLGLPCPRLQLTWMNRDGKWNLKECLYTIVIPLRDLDLRAEDANGNFVHHELHADIGDTLCEGRGKPIHNGEVDAPFRDGAHALWDSEVLHLPVYCVCDGIATLRGVKQ